MTKKVDNISQEQKRVFRNSLKNKNQSHDLRFIGSQEKAFIAQVNEAILKQFPKTGAEKVRQYNAAVVTHTNADFNPFDIFSNNVNLSDIYAVDAIRYRARDLQRNTPFAQRFLTLMKNNIIGPVGIKFKSTAAMVSPKGVITPDLQDQAAIEKAFADWSKRGNCSVLHSMNLKEVQDMVIETLSRDGEVLIRKHKSTKGYGFKLEIIDTGRLSSYTNSYNTKSKRNIFGGIELDEFLNPVAYHLGELQSGGASGAQTVVPADEIIHLFRKDFPTQIRGISWMACVMESLNQTVGYTEASVIAARIAASASAFIERPQLQDFEDDNDYNYPSPTNLEPAVIDELAPGEKIVLLDPKHPTTTYSQFMTTLLQHIASGLNVSYSALTGDRTKANNASNRIAVVEEQDLYKNVQNMIIDDFMTPVFDEWLGMALTLNMIKSGNTQLSLSKKDKYASARFIPRDFPSADPKKDADVVTAKMSNGTKSWTQAVTESGQDPETVLAEIKSDIEKFEALGLVYPGSATGIIPVVAPQVDGTGK